MKNNLIYTLIILCVLFWSGNFVIGRYIKDDIDALEMVFFRWGFTLIIISPILILKYKKIYHTIANNFFIVLLLSFLGISLFNTLLYIGLHTTTSTNALIINSSVPILIIILSFIIFKTKINTKQILAIILSTFGVLYLILKGQVSNMMALHFTQGDLWVILSSLSWALYSVLMRLKPKNLNDLELFSMLVFIGFMMILPVYLYQGYSLEEEIAVVKSNYLVFIYISLFTSVLSYYFWHKGIENIGAGKTGQFTHLMPIFGSILAYIFLDEMIQSYHLIGGFFILFGIYLSLFDKKLPQ
jgi:drug/metabolite transporter (DMT)-like permease